MARFLFFPRLRTLKITAAILLPILSLPAEDTFDVCVYGGNAAGVVAAVAASREGAKTVLVVPSPPLGGMVSSGLSVTDAGRIDTIGGIAREFFEKIGAHYQKSGPSFRHEPHVAKTIFSAMLAEARVTVWDNAPLAGRDAVRMDGTRITQIALSGERTVSARIFIDASYEGDLMAAAGVKFVIGRESRATYGEALAGVRNLIRHGDAAMASDEHGLLPDIHAGPAGDPGEGDRRIMSYTFRLCLTKDPANRVAIPRPDHYDPRRYTLHQRIVLRRPQATLQSLFSIGKIPGAKADFNNIGPVSSNLLNASWAYPEASPAERARIWDDHRNYLQGLLFFLQNDPRVPENLRNEAAEWGLARDEFIDSGHWPPQLYIREARRMVGEKVMTQHDLQNAARQPDAIGMGSYMMDSHYVQRTVTPDGLFSEGTLGGDHRVLPYQISYRSIVPKKSECTNLLVPVCLSASHVALASLRMEPVYMILAHSAGIAAAAAANQGIPVQDVPYDALRSRLIAEKQILEYEFSGQIDPASLDGIVRDEGSAALKGTWLKSTSGQPFVGAGYIHDNSTDRGNRIATYTVPLPEPGDYEVKIVSPAAANRSTRTKITVIAADGSHVCNVNQKQPLANGETAQSLGSFPFADQAVVIISNEGADGIVVADAVQLLPFPGGPGMSPPAGRTQAVPDAEESSRQKMAIDALAGKILATQLPDGAFRMSAATDTVRIVPYFGNLAALGLLATGDPRHHGAVRRWIAWYTENQEADGTIFDFTGTLTRHGKSTHRDSTDSYAATFLQLLYRYGKAAGFEALTPEMRAASVKALSAIQLTQNDDGLTWAKPDYKVKYLMDNLEVCQGLLDGERLFRAIGRGEAADQAAMMRRHSENGLVGFWQPELGHFAWAKGAHGAYHTSFTRWYPDGVAHLFAATALRRMPPGLWEKLKRAFGAMPELSPDWWLRAARTAGSQEEVAEFLKQTQDFAAALPSGKNQLNRLGTTLLALAENGDDRTTIEVCFTPEPAGEH